MVVNSITEEFTDQDKEELGDILEFLHNHRNLGDHVQLMHRGMLLAEKLIDTNIFEAGVSEKLNEEQRQQYLKDIHDYGRYLAAEYLNDGGIRETIDILDNQLDGFQRGYEMALGIGGNWEWEWDFNTVKL